jgi:hypothetical protein
MMVLLPDHKNGVNTDNRPINLELFCPNCDSQNRDTQGGGIKADAKFNVRPINKSMGGKNESDN